MVALSRRDFKLTPAAPAISSPLEGAVCAFGARGMCAPGGVGSWPRGCRALLLGYILPPSAEPHCPVGVTFVLSKVKSQGRDMASRHRAYRWSCVGSSPRPTQLLEPAAESGFHVCRWSVMAYETKPPRPASSSSVVTEDFSEGSEVRPLVAPCMPLLPTLGWTHRGTGSAQG